MNARRRVAVMLFVVVLAASQVIGAGNPAGVSPGAVNRIVEIEGRCPTFMWVGVQTAQFIELVVYRLPHRLETASASDIDLSGAEEVLYERVPGGATGWTPALADCLQPGASFVWFVRAVLREEGGEVVEASEWSEGRLFTISPMPSTQEVDQALQVLRRYVSDGDPGLLDEKERNSDVRRPNGARTAGSNPRAVSAQDMKSVTSASTAIRGEQSDTTGETYGVVGISNSANGAGPGAANANGGPDLVLDGSADGGQPDAIITQAGIDRPSASEEWFSLINSDTGVLSLNVEGTIVGDGSGLTDVDAELLDGIDAADFATEVEVAAIVSGHAGSADHDGRYFTESELNTSGGGGSVHWANLGAVPAGFADGVDDVSAYTVGDGVIIEGGEIRLDPAAFVPRVAVVDSTGDVGDCSSIAVGVDGFPLISYYDATNDNLKVAHCEDDGCTSATITVLDSIGGPYCAGTSVAIGADGLGLIGYIDETTYELKVAHCSNVACTGATITSLDSAGHGMRFPSVAIGVDDLGLIAYNHSNDDLMVAHCSNAVCTSAALSIIDSTTNTSSSSLTIGGDGLGLISYYDYPNETLKIAHCTDTACTNASTITVGPVGIFWCPTSIATGADGFGLVGYVNDNVGDLRVAHCLDAACSNATISIIRESGTTGSDSVSIAVDSSGFGLMSFADSVSPGVGVARCTNADCTPAVSTLVDQGGSVGSSRSIALGIDGRAWISYTEGGLKVVHLPFGY